MSKLSKTRPLLPTPSIHSYSSPQPFLHLASTVSTVVPAVTVIPTVTTVIALATYTTWTTWATEAAAISVPTRATFLITKTAAAKKAREATENGAAEVGRLIWSLIHGLYGIGF